MNSNTTLTLDRLRDYSWYGTTRLEIFLDTPRRLRGGLLFLCTGGEATAHHGLEESLLRPGVKYILLPGATFHVSRVSADFSARLFSFSRELFDEVSLTLGFPFIHYLRRAPRAAHDEGHPYTKNAILWADMAELVSGDTANPFRRVMLRDLLRVYLMYLHQRVRVNLEAMPPDLSRKRQLFHRFASLLAAHGHHQRDVRFYAAKLHITTRYLYAVTRAAVPAHSPKELIDRHLVLEIKILLQSPRLTISEIAYRLEFPNESYFCRYFKKHAGLSPSAYRAERLRDDGSA
ncbi:MAG: AraC family transcriptional regulator [Odoribacteraceae bacterium]|jgi:AraC-like DNA-binding protein|nr:AraC family transcriptional regulator [Odoribacteraceae bacterium]